MPSSCVSRCVPGFVVLLAWLGAPETSEAHFVLTSPPSMYEQNGLGDPQKAAPCGNHEGGATPTGEVTAVQGGDTITITIEETIFHPGHYRVALALDDQVFPEEPPVTPGSTDCGSAPIDAAPEFPVLADGLWEHTDQLAGPQSIEVTIPDGISCTNCTLQVIQFMSNHGLNDPGGCYYHHCATLSIEPSAGTGDETVGMEEESGPDPSGDPSFTTGGEGDPNTAGSDGTGEGGNADSGSTGGQGTSVGTVTEGNTADAPADDESGCSCTTPGAAPEGAVGMLLGLMGLMGLRHRRRRS